MLTIVRVPDRHLWRGWLEAVALLHDAECPEVLGVGPCCCCPRVERELLDNTITTDGKNLMRDALRGVVADLKIRYFGLGTDNTPPAAGQHTLVAESMRKITTSEAAGVDGESLATCYIAPAEAVVNIRELGFFAGSGATAAANSGVMVARVLYSRNKTAQESLQVVRHDQF